MAMSNREQWKATKHYTDPKIRWWNGHFITGLELQKQVIQ